ncbi:MAG: TonB-dependent receptor [Proteobacteria bacterium]|nr:TonB-dependent receptor [Pseudomonadota bacterium]
MADALAEFARQTGLHVVYVSKVVSDQRSHVAAAGMSAAVALGVMLEGTGLRFEFLTPHSVRILVAPPGGTPLLPAARQSPPELPEVMVTGSRIAVPPDIIATGPMQVLTVQDIRLAGHNDAVDLISALPQMSASLGADFGNHSNPTAGAGGFATVDLRGLGPQRTVVLINGRRLGLGDPNTANPAPAPDLDQIPLALIERVEVLTGGASATYGSDAIAGVVNFILKDDLQGLQVDGQYGFAQHTQQNTYIQQREIDAGITPPRGSGIDGFRRDVSVIAGSDLHDGNGHVTGYFIYRSQDAVHGSDRDFSDCSAHSTNSLTAVPSDTGVTCLLSNQSNLFVRDAGAGDAYSVVGNQFVPWPDDRAVPGPRFNAAPYYTSQRQNSRYQAGALAHYEFSQAAKPYLELSLMEDRTQTQFAPSGLFAGANPLTDDGGYLVNCSNPLLSAQQAALLCTPAQIAADRAEPGSVNADIAIGRRNAEGGGRQASYRHRNYRIVGGIDGNIADGWSYDAYALYYRTSLLQVHNNFLSSTAVANALQVTVDESGRAVCISGGGCVPYNIFKAAGVTPQQLSYLTTVGTDGGANSEQIIDASVTGQLARYGLVAPWAHEGVTFNAGAERRIETLRFSPDATELSGDLSGYGAAPVSIDERVSVSDGFLEARAPIAQDRWFVKDLTVDSAYRYSVYSTGVTTNTYKFDLQYAPFTDVRLRASYDRVVRAPNLIELHTPLSYNVSQTIETDPCAPTDGGVTPAAASLAACMRTGLTPVQYGNGVGPAAGGTSKVVQCSAGCGVIFGGNAALAPETANTWSLGLTFSPTEIPTLAGSVDYFQIRLKGEIGVVPESVTLQQCLATGDPTVCRQIVRTPTGALSGSTVTNGGYILATAVNTGAALVSGIDMQTSYRRLLAGQWGALTANLTGTWLQHTTTTRYRGAPSYDCAGLFGDTCLNGSVSPRWRHNLRVTWETPWNLQLSAQWRFIGRTGFDNNSSQSLLQAQEEGFQDPVLTRIPNYSYLDLAALWSLSRHVEVRAGISNVFDKDPPFVPLEVTGRGGDLNTFPIYDILGRNIFLGLRVAL